MAGTTPKLALRYPGAGDADNVPGDLLNLATDVEGAISGSGLLSARPAAGRRGRLYEATDTGQIFRDNSTGWDELLTAAAAAARYATRGARAYRAAALSPGNGVVTTIGLDGEAFDTATMHDLVTNNSRIVLNAIGLWQVTGQVAYQSSGGGGIRTAGINLNGTQVAQDAIPAHASDGVTPNVTTPVQATAITDYVELTTFQDSGAALSLSLASPAGVWLAAVYLGA